MRRSTDRSLFEVNGEERPPLRASLAKPAASSGAFSVGDTDVDVSVYRPVSIRARTREEVSIPSDLEVVADENKATANRRSDRTDTLSTTRTLTRLRILEAIERYWYVPNLASTEADVLYGLSGDEGSLAGLGHHHDPTKPNGAGRPDLRRLSTADLVAWVRSSDTKQTIRRLRTGLIGIFGFASGLPVTGRVGSSTDATRRTATISVGIMGRIFRIEVQAQDSAMRSAERLSEKLGASYIAEIISKEPCTALLRFQDPPA